MKQFLFSLVCVTLMMACSNPKEGETEQTSGVKSEQTAEERQEEIAGMEQEIKGFGATNRNPTTDAKADLLLKRYRDYVNVNPRDSITAEYLMRAADLSVGMAQYDAAIAYLDRLNKDFPTFRKTVEMMLYKGFIYENYKNDYANAVKSYQALIDRYPNHRLAGDAKASIENLSLSEEELIEKFKKQNSEEASSSTSL